MCIGRLAVKAKYEALSGLNKLYYPLFNMIEIPIEWILAVLIGLGGVISTLATVIWRSMNKRLEVQDRIITRLQDDVDRLSKGCGIKDCLWKCR